MTTDEAERAALAVAAEHHLVASDDALAIVADKTEERDVGWLFWVQSQRFLDTGDFDDEIVGVRPIFVSRDTGRAIRIAGEQPTDHEVRGLPEHDFPRAAFGLVGVAALGHAAALFVGWLAYDAAMGWLRAIPLVAGLVVGLVIGIGAAFVTGRVLEMARFVHLHRAIPIAVASVGTVVGELSTWTWAIIDSQGMGPAEALGYVPELMAIQDVEYLAIHGVAAVASVAAASTIGRQVHESKALWRGD